MMHQTIAAIRPTPWDEINQALLVSAKQDRLESGATVRLDSTVTAALMHEPSDSTLLSDAVRIMTRLLRRGAVGGAGGPMARSAAPGQEAGPRHRVQPRAGQKAPALSPADRRCRGQPRRTASNGRRAGQGGRDRNRALACRGRAVPAADRARCCPDPTPRA